MSDHPRASPSLRLDVPTLEPDDLFVERLAASAASARRPAGAASRRAGWRVGLATAGMVAVVGGGAWGATAVIGQQGGPTPHHHPGHAPASRPSAHPTPGGTRAGTSRATPPSASDGAGASLAPQRGGSPAASDDAHPSGSSAGLSQRGRGAEHRDEHASHAASHAGSHAATGHQGRGQGSPRGDGEQDRQPHQPQSGSRHSDGRQGRAHEDDRAGHPVGG